MSRGLRWDEAKFAEYQQRRPADPPQSPSSKTVSKPPLKVSSPVSVARPKKADALEQFHALGRLPKDEMNKTEALYAEHLEQRRLARDILGWRFHPMRIRLAKHAYYEVDFLVLASDYRLEIHETKGGFTTEKGQLKIRLAAEALPWFRMFKCSRRTQKAGGGWAIEEFNA